MPCSSSLYSHFGLTKRVGIPHEVRILKPTLAHGPLDTNEKPRKGSFTQKHSSSSSCLTGMEERNHLKESSTPYGEVNLLSKELSSSSASITNTLNFFTLLGPDAMRH
ncbi:hypothetical protein HMI55_001004 [Coelomomyces lativittatus]|nr:hypothetical protein HMI55_001004 [Coelomomyces lativittatus]